MVNTIIEERPVSLATVKKMLTDRAKGGEASYEQRQTMEYVKEFAKTAPKAAVEAVDKIIELGIDRKQAVKIVDLKPKDADDLTLIFSKVHYSIKEETVEKVLEIIRKIE